MHTSAIHSWVLDQLRKDEQVSHGSLHSNLNEDAEHAVFFLEYLVTRGVVRSEREGESTLYRATDSDAIDEIAGSIQTTEHPTDGKTDVSIDSKSTYDVSEEKIDESLVVNVPVDMQPEFRNLCQSFPNVDVITLREAFQALLDSATDEVRLAVPYLEQSGVNSFLDEIGTLAQRGVSVQVLTRDVLNGEGYDQTNKYRAISKLRDLYAANRRTPDCKLAVRDFGDRIRGQPGGPSRHYRGIHQKMVISDCYGAYVGSGEMRENSFLTNGEAGYLEMDSNRVKFWQSFFDLFWAEADVVPENLEGA